MSITHPSRFDQVQPGTGDETPCSPELELGFVGLKISAPDLVVFSPGNTVSIWGAFARVLLCGAYRLSTLFVSRMQGVEKSLTVVVTNLDTHVVYSGRLDHGHPRIPASTTSSEQTAREMEMAGQFESGWFNENVADYLPLPAVLARYSIFVTLGPYTSNVVTVSVRSREQMPH